MLPSVCTVPLGSVLMCRTLGRRRQLCSPFPLCVQIGVHVSEVVHKRFGRTILELGGNNSTISTVCVCARELRVSCTVLTFFAFVEHRVYLETVCAHVPEIPLAPEITSCLLFPFWLPVMDDADLDLAIRASVFGAVGTCGPRCTSLRRLVRRPCVACAL